MSGNIVLDDFLLKTLKVDLPFEGDVCESFRLCCQQQTSQTSEDITSVKIVSTLFLRSFHLLFTYQNLKLDTCCENFQKLLLLLYIEYPLTTLSLVEQIPVVGGSFKICLNTLNFMESSLSDSSFMYMELLRKSLTVLVLDAIELEFLASMEATEEKSSFNNNSLVSEIITEFDKYDMIKNEFPEWLQLIADKICFIFSSSCGEEDFTSLMARIRSYSIESVDTLNSPSTDTTVEFKIHNNVTDLVEYLYLSPELATIRKTLQKSREKCFAALSKPIESPIIRKQNTRGTMRRIRQPVLSRRIAPLMTRRFISRNPRNCFSRQQYHFHQPSNQRKRRQTTQMAFHERFGPMKRDNHEKNARAKEKQKQTTILSNKNALRLLRKAERRALMISSVPVKHTSSSMTTKASSKGKLMNNSVVVYDPILDEYSAFP